MELDVAELDAWSSRALDPPRLAEFGYVPLAAAYCACFGLLSAALRRWAWRAHGRTAHRRSRLCNLTVCLVHSALAGGGALAAFAHYGRPMVEHMIGFRTPALRHLATMSTGYFVHDALDMALHEPLSACAELLGHHALTAFTFACGLCSDIFLPYVAMALLMELHSVVLHVRTIGLLSGLLDRTTRAYTLVRAVNLVTLVVFRLVQQAGMLYMQCAYHHMMHWTYQLTGDVGLALFHCVNYALALRVLRADRWIGGAGGGSAEITHADEADEPAAAAADKRPGGRRQ